ncbi:MAG: methyltransferase [Clostridia bacterium]|nr:methyltransferase [Clostridia bacterium]
MQNERIDELGINNLKIIQNKEYFCFGIDSVLLANFVVSNSSKNVILDLCSGSGVIPVILSAKKKYKQIFGVELQDEMVDLFKRNILLNQLGMKIIPIQEDIKNVKKIRETIMQLGYNGAVDIIVCNPPYKKQKTGVSNSNNIKYIARHEVMCELEDVFETSSELLNTKGKLYLVHKPERLVDLLAIARKYQLEAKRIQLIQPTLKLKPSIVLVEYVKNGGNEIVIEKPLIEYKENGEYTEELLAIYGMDTSHKENENIGE